MDLRIEKTRRAITNAFIELRSKKPLEKITIKELCERALINKSTFYSHYEDIYALSDALENDVVHSVIASISHPERILSDTRTFTRELFLGYLSQEHLIKLLFSDSRASFLVTKIEASIKELFFCAYPELKDDPQTNLILSFEIYGGYYAYSRNHFPDNESAISLICLLSERIIHP